VRQHDERDLRTALREEADRHRPDRAAMLERITHGRQAHAPRPRDRVSALLRPAAAAVAVAVVLVLAVAGVRLANRGPEVDDRQVAAPTVAPATPAPATTATPKPSAAGTTTTATRPPRTPTGASSPATPATPRVTDRDGFLAALGQVDPHTDDGWSQGNVVLETTKKLTAVDVTVTVALTPGVVETGRWSTVPNNMLTMTSARTRKELVYRFTLKPGFTLGPGEYTFAAQFNHAAGKRPVTGDSYRAKAAAGGQDAKVSGGFSAP
jgi:hypothetical protein